MMLGTAPELCCNAGADTLVDGGGGRCDEEGTAPALELGVYHPSSISNLGTFPHEILFFEYERCSHLLTGLIGSPNVLEEKFGPPIVDRGRNPSFFDPSVT